MNAITYWITEHFSFTKWASVITLRSGSVPVLILDFDWANGEEVQYYAVTFSLLGLGASLAFWPRGKYDETDGAGV